MQFQETRQAPGNGSVFFLEELYLIHIVLCNPGIYLKELQQKIALVALCMFPQFVEPYTDLE